MPPQIFPSLLKGVFGRASFKAARAAMAQTGMTRFVIPTPAGDIPVTLIYPTETPAVPRHVGPFELNVAMDAPPAPGNGCLVVFSHGAGGDALMLNQLAMASTLACVGFMVAQPEHPGDNWCDMKDSGPVSWQRRPVKISQTIAVVGRDARFVNRLNLDRVGVFGVSAGGITGLALAGTDWSLATLPRPNAAHAVHPHDDANFCPYGAHSPEEAAARIRASERQPPTDAGQMLAGNRVRDPRVATVALAVSIGAIFTSERLAAIRVPVSVAQAQNDCALNLAYHSNHVLAHCGTCRRLNVMAEAEHFDIFAPWPAASPI